MSVSFKAADLVAAGGAAAAAMAGTPGGSAAGARVGPVVHAPRPGTIEAIAALTAGPVAVVVAPPVVFDNFQAVMDHPVARLRYSNLNPYRKWRFELALAGTPEVKFETIKGWTAPSSFTGFTPRTLTAATARGAAPAAVNRGAEASSAFLRFPRAVPDGNSAFAAWVVEASVLAEAFKARPAGGVDHIRIDRSAVTSHTSAEGLVTKKMDCELWGPLTAAAAATSACTFHFHWHPFTAGMVRGPNYSQFHFKKVHDADTLPTMQDRTIGACKLASNPGFDTFAEACRLACA